MRFFKLKGSLKCNNKMRMKAKEGLAKLTKAKSSGGLEGWEMLTDKWLGLLFLVPILGAFGQCC